MLTLLQEWARLWPQHISAPAAGPAFYARVYHPAFNVDLEDAEGTISAFQTHTRAVGKSVQGLRSVFGRVREARIGMSMAGKFYCFVVFIKLETEMSKAERLLSYSLLSLITSKPITSSHAPGTTSDEKTENGKDDERHKGLMNKDGAWCWREGCTGQSHIPAFHLITWC